MNLLVNWDIGIVGEGVLEMGNRFQREVHLEVDHAPVVHAEYEQHLAAAAWVLQEVVKL